MNSTNGIQGDNAFYSYKEGLTFLCTRYDIHKIPVDPKTKIPNCIPSAEMRTHYCQLAHTSKQMKSAETRRTNTIKTLKQNIIDSCTNLNKSKHTLTSSVQKECRQTRMIRMNPTRLKHKETSTPPSTSSRKHESVSDDEKKNFKN